MSYNHSVTLVNAGYDHGDIVQTLNAFAGGLDAPAPIDVPAGSNSGASDYETVLNIAVASAIAPKAKIAVYFATGIGVSDIVSTLHNMIHPLQPGIDSVPTILSISWCWMPDDDSSHITAAEYAQISSLFHNAAHLGITVCVSTGDKGAEFLSTTQAQVPYPATDPFVLACGGTTIGNINGSSFDEYVWNDSLGPDSGATGGGISARFPVPSWQKSAKPPKRNHMQVAGRGIPDVAGNASPNSGYPEFLGGTSIGLVGGTSVVAPFYAGLFARINEKLGENIGFLNPLLYEHGASVCRDVTGTSGPTNNSLGGVEGYPAHPGWDACTGWGSIDGSRLLAAIAAKPALATKIADAGHFGNVHPHAFAATALEISNTGLGSLLIANISSSSTDFLLPATLAYPLEIKPGESTKIDIRFHPISAGAKTTTLSIKSNDPDSPHILALDGNAANGSVRHDKSHYK